MIERLLRPLPLTVLILLSFASDRAAAQEVAAWHEARASYRFVTEPDPSFKQEGPLPEGSKGPPASTAIVYPTGQDPRKLEPAVFNAEGEKAGARVLWANPGEPMKIAFDTSSGSARYYIYLVEGAQPDSWSPQAGLLLESKNLGSAHKPNDPKSFVDLWNRGDAVPAGRSFRDSVFQGFPPHRPWDVSASSFKPSGAPTALHRYVGHFPVNPISDEQKANVAKAISDWQEKLKKAQEDERTWAKERSDSEPTFKSAEAALKKAEEDKRDGATINKLRRAYDLAKKRFDDANHRWEVATKRDIPTAQREIAIARQAQAELNDAVYTFHIGSVAGSWLLIDGKLLTFWPADRELENEGGRFKNLASGQLTLTPGAHRIEVFHSANGADHLSLLAWRRPGERTATVMPKGAFFATGRQVVKSAEIRDGGPLLFRWDLVRDYRVEGANDVIEMDFAIAGLPKSGHTYRWSFGDGDSAEGTAARHVFFRNGRYTVSLEELDGSGKAVRKSTQQVEVHAQWESTVVHDLGHADEVVAGQNLTTLPNELLVNAYRFARIASPEYQKAARWREKARAAIVARPEILNGLDAQMLGWLAEDSASFRVKAYDAALQAYSLLLPKVAAADTDGIKVRLDHAALLLHAFGKSAEAEKALQEIKDAQGEQLQRWNLLWGDLLLAKGDPDAAAEFLNGVAPKMDPAAETRFNVRNRGILRHARLLSESDDLDQIAHAIAMIDSVSNADPPLHLAPELNLIKLELYLARRDFVLAFHLSDRLLNFDYSELVRPKILGAQVRALHGLGATGEAKELFAKLKEEYPYSPAVGTAEAAMQPGS